MIDAGDVLVDGTAAVRSAKLVEDSWLEITLPEPDRPPVVVAQTVEGLTILYRDADIAVVDKPVGVAAHPEPRLDRADRARRAGRAGYPDQHLRAPRSAGASCTGSTSAPPG